MSISSNTLFHFTNSINNVENILQNEFHPHFSLEDFNIINQQSKRRVDLEFAIPMVSFCDIPLSQISKHLKVYGRYGIGMRKEWGMNHGTIAPVLYTYRNSRLARLLFSMVLAINKLSPSTPESNKAQDRFYDLTCYIKPYQGKSYRNNKPTVKMTFYNEREWRYVPRLTKKDHYRYGLSKSKYFDDNYRQTANKYLQNKYTLHFNPSDIKYIIVDNENEIIPMIRAVETIKDKYSPDEIRKVISRIVTSNQIEEDF